jgi:ABC-type multidrug transport system ATPase subunit
MTEPLQIIDLVKEYDELDALHHVNLSFSAAQLVALVGHNGAGKSTLLGIIAGLIEPSEGEVLVAGHPAGTLPARAELTYAGDNPILYDDLSVWEHLEYVAGLHDVANWREVGRQLLDRFDLLERADDLPSRFSRGMRQKAALAAALVRPASVVIVDEPFVGLDIPAQQALVDVLVGRARAGATVIVATHQPAFLSHTDRCVLMHDGTVARDEPPSDALIAALQRQG